MKMLVHNVIWPAVAGNILWAFLQVAAAPQCTDPKFWFQLTALLLVGVYLSIDWVVTEKNKENLRDMYWIADIPLSASLAVFAIATQLGTSWAWIPLLLAFIVAAIGHSFGAWDLKLSPSSCRGRATFAGMNLIGAVILLGGWWANSEAVYHWTVPAAVLAVVVLFLSLRNAVARW